MSNVARFRRAKKRPPKTHPRRRARLPILIGLAVVVGAVGGFLLFEVTAIAAGERSELSIWWDKLGDFASGVVGASGLSGCHIKGNISAGGEHIYHVPGDRYYGATRIDFLKGERYFCSESEARAAGWRRARV